MNPFDGKAAKRSREDTLVAAEEASASAWTAKMEAEVTKQRAKQQNKRCVAANSNILLDEEVDAELQANARDYVRREQINDKRAVAAAKAVAHNNSPARPMEMRNCICYTMDAVKDEVAPLILRRGLRAVPEPCVRVAFIILPDPARPGQRASWIAALTGARLVVPEFIATQGQCGACVQHVPAAINQRRRVWISDACMAGHPRIGRIVDEARRLPQSRWRRLPTQAAFCAARPDTGFSNIAFVTIAEKRAPVFRNKRNVFTVQTFLPWIDKNRGGHGQGCTVGDCGR